MPNCDVILMFKILIIQQYNGLSDLEVERQMADRTSFMAFLGFPDPFPDSRTIWLFKERMAKTKKDVAVWAELQRQLDAMGLKVKRGTIQSLESTGYCISIDTCVKIHAEYTIVGSVPILM